MLTVPNLLSATRLGLVPILLGLAWTGHPKIFLGCLIAALLTDMSDGFLARKLHQTSELGAKLDSWGDLATYIALPFCAWWLRPDVLRAEAIYLATGIFFYVAAIVFGFVKFGRLPSYHTWGGKLGAILVGGVGLILFAGGPGWPLRVVVPFVVLSSVEEIAISVILSSPQTDVLSLWHALKIRQRTQAKVPLK